MGNRFKTAILFASIFIATLFSFVLSAGDADAQTHRTPPRPAANPTPKPSEAEQLLWQEALRLQTKDAYAFYLREYPRGVYTTEARKRIVAIDEVMEKAKWDTAVSSNTRASFESYLKEYPNGRFVSQANDKIRQFERVEEDALWNEAGKKDDVDSYTDYLKKYPRGVYAAIARLRLQAKGVTAPEAVGTTRTNPLGMQFSWIPPGSFMMGSPASEAGRDSDGLQRLVTIARGFWMGRYEVTQWQYEVVMGTNPSGFKNCGKDCPVEQVSWNDAKEFIRRLNDRNDGFVYSLPSEAEWEYAARAATTTAFAFGDSLSSTQANFDGNYPYGNAPKGPYLERTTKVGSYDANAWGLYDMHGNVWEWVEDIYNKDGYTGLPTDGSANTTRGDNSSRVLRGGSWVYDGGSTRSAFRNRGDPTDRYGSYGFRVVARAR